MTSNGPQEVPGQDTGYVEALTTLRRGAHEQSDKLEALLRRFDYICHSLDRLDTLKAAGRYEAFDEYYAQHMDEFHDFFEASTVEIERLEKVEREVLSGVASLDERASAGLIASSNAFGSDLRELEA